MQHKMETINIRYLFRLPDNRQEVIDLHLDARSLNLLNSIPEELPAWTGLEFLRCKNCLLTSEENPHCPVAVHFLPLLNTFADILSYDIVYVNVITSQRVISKETSAQKAVSSLMGLIMATSGCPHTVFLKPMARFHLPFADSQETVYRAISMYLLARYFVRENGKAADPKLDGLKTIYSNIQIVNEAMASRLRAISDKDVAVNSLVILDAFAQTVPFVIEDSLEDLRYLFEAYLMCPGDPDR
jgi:hypothetical protein